MTGAIFLENDGGKTFYCVELYNLGDYNNIYPETYAANIPASASGGISGVASYYRIAKTGDWTNDPGKKIPPEH